MKSMKNVANPFLFYIGILITILLTACGPTKEELRIRTDARAKEQEILRTRQEALEHSAEERVKAGDKGPLKVNDPGFRVVTCYEPAPPDEAVSLKTPFGSYVCGNTSAGSKVVEWRKWYCKGESDDCVLSKWTDGQPTFGYVQSKMETTKWSSTVEYKIGPYRLR